MYKQSNWLYSFVVSTDKITSFATWIILYTLLYTFWHLDHVAVRFLWKHSGNSLRLYFLGSKITADGDCSHEIKRRLFLGRKVMTNLDRMLKSRNNTLLTKFHLVKAMVFPVVMCGCESWTITKLSTEELMLLNCGVGEDSWESLGLQEDPTSPS